MTGVRAAVAATAPTAPTTTEGDLLERRLSTTWTQEHDGCATAWARRAAGGHSQETGERRRSPGRLGGWSGRCPPQPALVLLGRDRRPRLDPTRFRGRS